MGQDFERTWQSRLSRVLDAAYGQDVRQHVLQGGMDLNDSASRLEVIAWTCQTLGRLESSAGVKKTRRILSACACHYPQSELAPVRARFLETGDIAAAHHMLQSRFEAYLELDLDLPEEMRGEIVRRGWGLAGVLSPTQIIATKMPKSGTVREYFAETDARRRRALYCHCPRVRQPPVLGDRLPASYCYCGAGFYKGMWEYILGSPVEVEVLTSVLQGDDECSIAIHLPDR
ncbi:MAG: hypothetical protein NTY23_03140 [Chloroflexi bacterium]|nr:hypothetical protein [Chloroflexota bacterium]